MIVLWFIYQQIKVKNCQELPHCVSLTLATDMSELSGNEINYIQGGKNGNVY